MKDGGVQDRGLGDKRVREFNIMFILSRRACL